MKTETAIPKRAAGMANHVAKATRQHTAETFEAKYVLRAT